MLPERFIDSKLSILQSSELMVSRMLSVRIVELRESPVIEEAILFFRKLLK